MNFFYSIALQRFPVSCLLAARPLAPICFGPRAPARTLTRAHQQTPKNKHMMQFICAKARSVSTHDALEPRRNAIVQPLPVPPAAAPRRTRLQHLLSRQQQQFHASAACSFWRQTAHGTHIHKLRLCQRAVAVLVEDSPHNIQQIGPQLQGGIGEEKCERRLRGESLRMAVGGIGVCFSWRERLV